MINSEIPEEGMIGEVNKWAKPFEDKGYNRTAFYCWTEDYWRVRYDNPNPPPDPEDPEKTLPSKVIRPISKNDSGLWELKEKKFPKGKKPLYMRHGGGADPNAPWYLVEGERKVDVLAALGIVAVTSGSCTSAKGADWMPLKGRGIIVWPDNDKSGLDYAKAVTSTLRGLGCTVRWVDIAKLILPEGGDVVDWLKANPGSTKADIENLPKFDPPASPDTAEDGAIDLSKAILDFDGLMNADIPERKLILPWLPEGGLAMVFAPRGLGKTFFGISLAVAVASGAELEDL